jgi:hypothetical protein
VNAPIVGMYVHQHWAYAHPYAARTWTPGDWRGYAEGLRRIGYNALMIWPMLEIVPDPPTGSDLASIRSLASVIGMIRGELGMRVDIVITPNVAADDAASARYAFQDRPFFLCDRRLDPADPAALAALIARREWLLAPLAEADGLVVIDSDPGGYPDSLNRDFVSLLGAHRAMLDRLRRGIELTYWCFAGWEAYGRYYATARFAWGPDEESEDCIRRLAALDPEPWALMGPRVELARRMGLERRMCAFRYGAIEGEPSFPLTGFGGDSARGAGGAPSGRGVMGNAQTHCLQLPNTFAFARGARGLPLAQDDYLSFAEELLPGHGARVVGAWSALAGEDVDAMSLARAALEDAAADPPRPGPLEGLLFGDPARLLRDLGAQLRMKAALLVLRAAAGQHGRESGEAMRALGDFAGAASAWQRTHGYRNYWPWPLLQETLGRLDAPTVNQALRQGYEGEGETPFERVRNGFARVESYTPRLIEAMERQSGHTPLGSP